MRWCKRIRRCREPTCRRATCQRDSPTGRARARLTSRAVAWAADALAGDNTTVAALARRLDVDWHTLWDDLAVEAQRRAADPARWTGSRASAWMNTSGGPVSSGQAGRSPAWPTCPAMRTGRSRPVCSTSSSAGPGRPTAPGSPPSRWSSGPASSTRCSTRSAATPTPCATTSPKPCRCWTSSTSSSSAPRSSTKSAAATSSSSGGAATSTTRCSRSAGRCDTAWSRWALSSTRGCRSGSWPATRQRLATAANVGEHPASRLWGGLARRPRRPVRLVRGYPRPAYSRCPVAFSSGRLIAQGRLTRKLPHASAPTTPWSIPMSRPVWVNAKCA